MIISKSTSGDGFMIRLSARELSAISNCINEARECVDIEEFHTRIGAHEQTVKEIHHQILKALRAG